MKRTYLLILLLIATLFYLPASAQEEEIDGSVTILSWGQAQKTVTNAKLPRGKTTSPDNDEKAKEKKIEPNTAEGRAVRNALTIYLLQSLTKKEFEWLEEGIDSVILPWPEKFVIKIKVVSSTYLPASKFEIVKAKVTLNASLLNTYIENVKKLKPMPKGPTAPTLNEKDRFKSRGDKIFMQGEVASNILMDYKKGIETFAEAKKFYEKAEYEAGVFMAVLSMGSAKVSLGDFDGAMIDLKKGFDLSNKLGNYEYKVRANLETAKFHMIVGNCKMAKEAASLAVEIASKSILSTGSTEEKVPGALLGEALLLLGKADYLLKNIEDGKIEVSRAIAVFETLGDLKKLNEALITLNIMMILSGEASDTIERIRLSKKISEALKDDESRTVALITLGRALREIGELEGAKIYAIEAKATAKKAKWMVGEAMALMEISRIFTAGKKGAPALTSAVDALELSKKVGSPTLISSAYWTLGLAQLASDQKKEALLSFAEVFNNSADAMTTKFGVLSLPIETLDFDGLSNVLSLTIILAKELGDEEVAFSALLSYHGIWCADRLHQSNHLFDNKRGILLSHWRKSIGNCLATERISLSRNANRFSESSTKILNEKRESLKKSLIDSRKEIVRTEPSLAALLAIVKRSPKQLAREIDRYLENSILVQYFMGADTAFALVTSRGDLKIVILRHSPEKIRALSDHMAGIFSGKKKKVVPTPISNANDDIDIPTTSSTLAQYYSNLSFEETSRRLHTALISPILSSYPNAKNIGISTGIAFKSLPFLALGNYNGEGSFTFAVEDYNLFLTSSLFPSLFNRTTVYERATSTIDYLAVVGSGGFSPEDVRWLFYEVSAVGIDVDENNKITAGNETLIAVNDADSYPWWEGYSPAIIVFNLGLGGEKMNSEENSSFLWMEIFASYKDCPYVLVSSVAVEKQIIPFFEETIPEMREAGPFRGYFISIRALAAKYRETGSLDWIHFPIMQGF